MRNSDEQHAIPASDIINYLQDDCQIDAERRSIYTVIDRFGTKGVAYSKLDETHFTVSVEVEISEQFFSWICGFGNKAKIL